MPPAFDDTIVHLTLGQRDRFVRALVVHREQLTTGAHQAHGDLINHNTEGSVLDKIGGRAGARPGHDRYPRHLTSRRRRRLDSPPCTDTTMELSAPNGRWSVWQAVSFPRTQATVVAALRSLTGTRSAMTRSPC